MPTVLAPLTPDYTVRDCITAALRHLAVLAAAETPGAEDADAGLQALTGLLDAWRADTLMAPGLADVPEVLSLGLVLTLPAGYRRALEWCLARELVADFAVPQAAEARAERNAARFRRAAWQPNVVVPELSMDEMLLQQPSAVLSPYEN